MSKMVGIKINEPFGDTGPIKGPALLELFWTVHEGSLLENIKKQQRGTISSFYSSARFIGVAAGPPVVSLVLDNFLNGLYITFSVAGLILLFIVIKFIDVEELEKRKKAL